MSADAVRLHPADQVATALRSLEAGSEAVITSPDGPLKLTVREAIPAFHKLALADLQPGERVSKYGAVIGAITAPVAAGDLVHVHNLSSLKAKGDLP